MGKIYVGQTALTIRVTTNINLSTANIVQIKYKKPNGDTGTWTATIYNESRGVIDYSPTLATVLDEDGNWSAWAYITFNDGTIAAGQVFHFYIHSEGE